MQGKVSSFRRRFYLLIDLWDFMKVNKKWWLLPIILMLLFVSVLIFISTASPISPFIYVLV
ncbi:MAG: hypothetical protein GTN76_08015 [Candidatus Aenigmarchaeota archaeon]|nr:hypothetical protein [Candidatus Aenigmarchaeota archaeon]